MAAVTSYLARLDNRGSIAVQGPDSRQFLQGQTTCDITQLNRSHSLVGAYCNPQGRMICDFRLWELADDSLLMGLEADAVDAALSTFGKYAVFSKAELSDAGDAYQHYALWGDSAAEFAGGTGGDTGTCWQRGETLWTVSDMPDCFEALVPETAVADFELSLAETERARESDFRLREIRAGIGHVTGATSGLFLPQMLNFQHTGRVSFRKGCYTGQEVVARMHYRGKVKRPMLFARAPAGSEAAPGDPLFRAGGEQTVGNVVLATTGDEALELLVSVATDALENGVTLGPEGPALELSEPPYSLG